MPIESGPTQLLPYSQRFERGFLAYRNEEYAAIFREQYVQLPLQQGDAVVFNPALFHAAGENTSIHIHRSANLLQVSACWGRAMETVDRTGMILSLWSEIRRFASSGQHHPLEVDAILAVVCEGYSFPTNLDHDPPPADGVSECA
jgi:ectoine hydroxylase-related dioxygenase (phytanoyl-CoA dioxygenase family)